MLLCYILRIQTDYLTKQRTMIKLLGRTLSILLILCVTFSLDAQNKWTEAECVTIETGTRTFYLHKNSKIRVHYDGGKKHSRIKSISKDYFVVYKGEQKINFNDIKKMRIYNDGKWVPSFFIGSLVLGNLISGTLQEPMIVYALGVSIPRFVYWLVTSKVVKKSANKAKHDIQSIKKGEHRNEYVKPIGF